MANEKYQRAPHPRMVGRSGRRTVAPPATTEPEPEIDERGPLEDPRRNLIKMPRLTFLERRFSWE